ncbi:unnamed protein product [Clavelina lepadiformis]|uniref:Rho GTPase n=1 Tax=Clavelina lepadiformis TaxID=159417 RepID=A0ABP0F5F9_CLALP
MENSSPIKIVVVGDGAVGKTSLYSSYTTGKPFTAYVPTVFESRSFHATLNGIQYILNLYDTPGAEDYDRLRPLSYPGTDVVLVLFSLVNRASFENVSAKWIPELRKNCPNTIILLVGMKADLRNNPETVKQLQKAESTPIEYEEGLQLSKRIRAAKYMECSSMTNEGVHDIFAEAIKFFQKKEKNENKKCCAIS